ARSRWAPPGRYTRLFGSGRRPGVSSGTALLGPWMKDSGLREPGVGDLRDPFPRHTVLLATALIPNRVSLPRYGCRVGLRIVLFEACSAFTRVTACTLALSPYLVTRLSEGFSHFV